MKGEKGITLVALIITIIILLVLVVVSINLVMNSGIIDKAEHSISKYIESEIGEQIKLAYSEYQIKEFEGTEETAEKIIGDRLKETFEDENLTVKVNNGKVIVNTTVKDEPKTYIYKLNTGEVYESKDPSEYENE